MLQSSDLWTSAVRMIPAAVVLLSLALCPVWSDAGQPRGLRAGAAQIDVSPKEFPAIIAGGFLEKTATSVQEPLHARAMALDDGSTRLCIVVVDTLFVPRDLADEVKQSVSRDTGIPPDRMLISATHTHSAPSLESKTLGSDVDKDFRARMPGWLTTVIRNAVANLQPARVGWAAIDDPRHTNCRRWIRRPDRIGADPFGEQTVRAMMHPGYQNPDYIGPAGAVDSGLSLLSVQSAEGRPLAVLANYSMHYFGSPPVHPDYYGLFCRELAERIAASSGPPPVVMMSQGTSGDLHWMDYSLPRRPAISLQQFSHEMTDVALRAYQTIRYQSSVPLAMAETKITLDRRVPDARRLAWARQIVGQMGDRKPKDQKEVYARQQVYLHDEPRRQLKLQAVRIGDLGITAIPCEVFGITGLKLKAQSPLPLTFNIELANGCEGYIPPPEQHKLGGYTTWPARTAGLEVQAEPKIVAAVLELLEKVSGLLRREPVAAGGAYVDAVLDCKPLAYWRMHEFNGPEARDASGNGRNARYQDPLAYYLEGPQLPGLGAPAAINRAVHLAGGCVRADVPDLGPSYGVEMWFWNGLPADARRVTGYLFSRPATGDKSDCLGIGGAGAASGKLFFAASGAAESLVGRTEIGLKTWNHVALVRAGDQITVYLNGSAKPEIQGRSVPGDLAAEVLVGSDPRLSATWEGKLDEVALYNRALTAAEIARHHSAAGAPADAAPQP